MEKDTMAYQLAVLRDTQMVQRRQLEAMYPYIDWERMPFSSYGDFFRLRSIMEECGEVWTNAYGRSNTEAESTRKYLKDYSGKGRDIELFNFGYSKQSGFNGYVQDFRNFILGTEITNSTITESKMILTNTNIDEANQSVGSISKADYINKGFRIKVSSLSSWAVIIFYTSDYTSSVKSVNLKEGILDIPALTDEEWSSFGFFSLNIPKDGSVVIEQLPAYRGAIVSDGVDDYGQCIKDFALPDDYTVVAMREILARSSNPALLSKTHTSKVGAFIFENLATVAYDAAASYGTFTRITIPKLFTYQTKSTYNGTDITAGSADDTDEDKLLIFKIRPEISSYLSAALYSFGIFSRTLTDEELRIVENCMYAEWIAMTGQLEGIEYYDILDARFRSNDEDADKRNRWVGRFGKLHMTLHNYAYSQMSGWNGWPLPRQCTFSVAKQGSSYWLSYMGAPAAVKTNSWGIRIVSNPTGDPISLIYISSSNTVVKTIALNEGTVNIIPPMTEDFANLAFSLPNHPVGSVVEFEQIPLYGGALVSDGVDDYAVSDEVIDEEIGGVVAHAELLGGTYLFAYNLVQNSIWGYKYNEFLRIADAAIDDNQVTATNVQSDRGVFAYSRTPALTTGDLFIARTANSSNPEPGQNALYQLRLIKTQPTDVQLEAIKWQCRKEHDDYLIHRGWKEVE